MAYLPKYEVDSLRSPADSAASIAVIASVAMEDAVSDVVKTA